MMMEKLAILLILVMLFILIIIVGLLSVLVYKLLKAPADRVQVTGGVEADNQAHPDSTRPPYHPEILERMKGLQGVKNSRSDLFCPNHANEPGEVMCAICDQLFCKSCIRPFKTLHFCKEHLPLLMRYEWDEVLTLKTSTQSPDEGVRLFDVKKELFQKEDIPTYVETHYKINVDQDHIETYLVLFSVKDKKSDLQDRLRSFLANF